MLSGEIHFFKLPDKPDERLYNELTEIIVDAIQAYNNKSKKGWASGFIRIKTSELSFGEVAICDECTVHYLLENTDFQEVGDQLLCSVCQASRRET